MALVDAMHASQSPSMKESALSQMKGVGLSKAIAGWFLDAERRLLPRNQTCSQLILAS